jgi:hypothetical protein
MIDYLPIYLSIYPLVLRIEPRTSFMLVKWSATWAPPPPPHPLYFVFWDRVLLTLPGLASKPAPDSQVGALYPIYMICFWHYLFIYFLKLEISYSERALFLVARASILSYIGGWDQEDGGSRPSQANSSWDPPHLQNNQNKIDWMCGSNPSPIKQKEKTVSFRL